MHVNRLLYLILSLFVISAGGLQAAEDSVQRSIPVSGQIEKGYRVLSVEPSAENLHLTVYRGDYIKFRFDSALGEPVFRVPDLGIAEKITGNPDEAPYFKMKTAGRYPFFIGNISGFIEVVEYRESHYREVTAKQAADLIRTGNPLILDVRTRGEFKRGRIEGAVLIPLQELQKRAGELSNYREKEILIYCATGNRSTVASKILIDKGFQRITNMRKGIVEWAREKLPITR